MTRIVCFYLEPQRVVQRELRRYRSSSEAGERCPANQSPYSYHDARVVIERVAEPTGSQGGLTGADGPPTEIEREDPRWPTKCDACGEPFEAADPWQTNEHRLYRRSDTGELTTWKDAPPGAIMDATWLHDCKGYGGPDGRVLMVRCPCGTDWIPDGPASNGPTDAPGWTRTGEIPKLTIRASIQTGKWHGFMTDGVLHE